MQPNEPYVSEAERMRQHLRDTLTRRELLVNWWRYHWHYFAVLLAALAVVFGFAQLDKGIAEPDYTVGWVSAQELDEAAAQQISERFAQFGEDLNGDGTVTVNIHQIPLDIAAMLARGGTEGQKEYGALMALEADLSSGESGIFLTDDAASFQRYTGALLYRDGTVPERSAEDWENMTVSFELTGIGPVYAGLRGCWNERQQAHWEESRALWSQFGATALR